MKYALSLLLGLGFGSLLMAQTVIVGPADQYAFQWNNGTANTLIGLSFTSSQNQFQFRDSGGNTVFSINPVIGQVRAGDNVANYSAFGPDGDLRFFGNADYTVANNRYAFRSLSDQDNGLFFNVTDNQYEFRANDATPGFTIKANTAGGDVTGSFHTDGDGDIDGDLNVDGLIRIENSLSNNASTNGPLTVGPIASTHIALDNNEVQSYSGSTAGGTLYHNFYGGNVDIVNNAGGGDLSVSSGALHVEGSNDFVGIGTSGPDARLHVAQGVDASLTGNGYIMAGSEFSSNLIIDNNEIMTRNNGLASGIFLNNNGGDIILNGSSAPAVAIGHSGPEIDLHLEHEQFLNAGLMIENTFNDAKWSFYSSQSTSDLRLLFGTGLLSRGQWDDVSGSYSAVSDARLKDDIEFLQPGASVQKILDLKPASYTFKHDPDRNPYLGFLAQDLEQVIPEAVSHVQDDGNGEELLMVNYDAVIPVLVGAVQEIAESQPASEESLADLRAENEALKADLEDLRRIVKDLRRDVSACCSVDLGSTKSGADSQARLGQNVPNPSADRTAIPYFLPENTVEATLEITDLSGRLIHSESLTGSGYGEVNLTWDRFESGTYLYSLLIEGMLIDSKRMVWTR